MKTTNKKLRLTAAIALLALVAVFAAGLTGCPKHNPKNPPAQPKKILSGPAYKPTTLRESPPPVKKSEIKWRAWSKDVFDESAREKKNVVICFETAWQMNECETQVASMYETKINQSRIIPVKVNPDERPDISLSMGSGYGDAKYSPIVGRVNSSGHIDELLELQKTEPFRLDNAPFLYAEQLPARKSGEVLTEEFAAVMAHKALDWTDVIFIRAPHFQYKFADMFIVAFHITNDRKFLNQHHIFGIGMLYGRSYMDDVFGGVDRIHGKLLKVNAGAIETLLNVYSETENIAYMDDAKTMHRYIAEFLAAPSGDAFYNAQGIEVSANGKTISGWDYSKLNKQQREAVGMPIRDKTLYTGANAQAASAYFSLYAVLGWETALETAEKTLDNIWKTAHTPGKGVTHKFGKTPQAGPYFLTDQVQLLRALLDAYSDTGNNTYLDRANELVSYINKNFYDPHSGAYFLNTADSDIATWWKIRIAPPFENALLAECFNRLSYYTGDDSFRIKAVDILLAFKDFAAADHGFTEGASAAYARAAMLVSRHPLQMVVLGSKTDPRTTAMLRAALKFYEPRKVVFALDPAIPADKARLAKLPYKPYPAPTLFACVETACAMPISDPSKVEKRMKAFADKFLNPSAPGQNRIQIQPGAPR